ncbi:MAG: site-specific integrase [Clostridia bacterium]|nr:site-specific integrase [Clostridia bacterium]
MKKQYQYEVATLRLPSGKRKYIRGKTKEELAQKVEAIKRELLLGIDIGNNICFKQYAEHWFTTTRNVGIKPGTARILERNLKNHIYPMIGGLRLRDIKPSHIRTVMHGVSHLGKGTQTDVLHLMRDIFAVAVDDDIIVRTPVSPTIKAKGKTADEVHPLTPDQEAALLKAAEGLQVYPAVFIILHTGLRRGELAGLMWSDIDYDARVIHVQRHVIPAQSGAPILEEGAKTASGNRYVPIPDALATYLKELQSSTKSVYVFPNKKGGLYSHAALGVLWKTLDGRAGFHTHPHQLRHTYATKLFEQGLDIKQIQYVMGHADPSITLKVYTHYREGLRRESTVQQVIEAFG